MKTEETKIIKELKIEVQTEISQKGKSFDEIKIPEGWRLLTTKEIIFLYNNKTYRKELNLEDTWEFIEQPFELNKKNNFVARFCAYSGRAYFVCNRYPSYWNFYLGVRFCRDCSQEINMTFFADVQTKETKMYDFGDREYGQIFTEKCSKCGEIHTKIFIKCKCGNSVEFSLPVN